MSFDPRLPDETGRRPISRDGISVEVPKGWESRIRRAEPGDRGGITHPVLHAATVPLSGNRADYGAGVVERLGDHDIFISLVEYGEEAVGSALFPDVDKIPILNARMFHPSQLQRRLPGQAGVQVFFTIHQRAFCLYVVLGTHARRIPLTARSNELLRGLSVDATP